MERVAFISAKDKLMKDGSKALAKSGSGGCGKLVKKTLGGKRKFLPPFKRSESSSNVDGGDSFGTEESECKIQTRSAFAKQQQQSARKRAKSEEKENHNININNDDEVLQQNSTGNIMGISNSPIVVEELLADPRLKGCEEHMIQLILSEIIDQSLSVKWDDIAGLEFAKETVKEAIINPLLRPDIFKGIRQPPKGLLLFGPPGTGKVRIYAFF